MKKILSIFLLLFLITGTAIAEDRYSQEYLKTHKHFSIMNPVAESFARHSIKAALKKETDVPIIYNSGGYDSPENIAQISDYTDVFMPDFKYIRSETALKYSHAPDYPEVAKTAVAQMLALRPRVRIDENGIMREGVLIRHLVLPGHRAESMEIIDYAAQHFQGALMSVMSQYTPDFNRSEYKNLSRRITSFEYQSVVDYAAQKGIRGFSQLRLSADKNYTPSF